MPHDSSCPINPLCPLLTRRAPVDTLELPFEVLPELVLRYSETHRIVHEHAESLVESFYLLLAHRLFRSRRDHGPHSGATLDQTHPPQLAVRLHYGVRRYCQLLREPAYRR